MKSLHALNVGGEDVPAIVTVNGGTFVGPKDNNPSEASLKSCAAVNVQSDGEVIINGGNFSKGKNKTLAKYGDTKNNAKLTVSGGAYDEDPSAYAATGYKAMQGGSLWYVVPSTVDALISNTAELTTALTSAGDTKSIVLCSGTYTVPDLSETNYSHIKSLTIEGTEGTKVEFDGGNVVLTNLDQFTIRNCEILHMAEKSWGMIVFCASNNSNGVYTVDNCTFKGVHTQGVYINENKSGATYNITNCTFNGDFDGATTHDGAITIQNNDGINHIVNVTGCTFNVDANNRKLYMTTPYRGFTLNTDLDSNDVIWKQ